MHRREALAAIAAPFALPTPATPGRPRGERAIYRHMTDPDRWERIEWTDQQPGDGILGIDFDNDGAIHKIMLWRVKGWGTNVSPENGGPEVLTDRWEQDALFMQRMLMGIAFA